MKAIFTCMVVVAGLLVVSDAEGAARRQVVRQKTVIRGGAARGIGGSSISQTTIVNGGAVANVGVQRSFVRQRSFSTGYYVAPVVQAQVFAAPVYQQQVQLQAAPILQAAPVYQQAVVQQQVQVQAAPVLQAAPVYCAPAQQMVVQAAPVMAYSAPAVQFDVMTAGCVAPAAGIVRQRTVIRGY